MRIAWNDDEAAMAFRLCSEEVRSHCMLLMLKFLCLSSPALALALGLALAHVPAHVHIAYSH